MPLARETLQDTKNNTKTDRRNNVGKHLKRKIVNRKGHSFVLNSQVTVLRANSKLRWRYLVRYFAADLTKIFLQQPRGIADRTLKYGKFYITKWNLSRCCATVAAVHLVKAHLRMCPTMCVHGRSYQEGRLFPKLIPFIIPLAVS